MKAELFPVAQAILAAFRQRYDETLRPGPFVDHWQEQCLAAALRAAANRVEDLIPDLGSARFSQGVETSAAFLESIATELENNNA